MGTKQDPGKFDCYTAAEPDEPMFVLLARDPQAAPAVRSWAMARANVRGYTEKVSEALKLADAMETWRHDNCAPPTK
jgi:lipocalin